MARQTTLVITVPAHDLVDAADYIRLVADQLAEGYTSGHHDADHHWNT